MFDCTVIELDNRTLGIQQDTWQNSYNQPEQYRNIWPTGVESRLYPHLVGQKCRYDGMGCYKTEGGATIALEYGGNTKPHKSETRPIKPPKRGKGYTWKWLRGEWSKHWNGQNW